MSARSFSIYQKVPEIPVGIYMEHDFLVRSTEILNRNFTKFFVNGKRPGLERRRPKRFGEKESGEEALSFLGPNFMLAHISIYG